jgi:hypothetical protein
LIATPGSFILEVTHPKRFIVNARFFDVGFTGWNVQPFDREVAVRFQTNEAVAVQDREVVLRALETCLRGVSNEVVRYGDKITLHGLGPSPKAVNYQDTTVLSVSAENDKTIINADVSFQASSILGDVQQDEVVRSKLDKVFDEMRLQIFLESRGAALGSTTTGSTMASSSSPLSSSPLLDGPTSESSQVVAPGASISPTPVAPLETTEEPAEHLEAPALPVVPVEKTEEPAEHLETPAPVPLDTPPTVGEHGGEGEAAALVTMLRRQLQNDDEDESEPGSTRRLLWLVAAIVALFLVAGGVYLLRFRSKTVASRPAATVSAPTASVPTAPAQPVATPAAPAAPATPSPDAGARTVTKIDAATIGRPPDSSAPSAPKAATADPAVWVEGWAAAMRSRDPVAQASFYADPVSQYIDRKNVSRAALVQVKKADIGRRHGDWTFSANNVVVESRTPSEATVQLVKHYMVRTGPSQVSEIFVKTQLQLKSVDGQWKIVSEEELRSPAIASANPIDQ